MSHERATVTCSCGASITVRALTVEEARWQTEAFLAAHEACREVKDHERFAICMGEKDSEGVVFFDTLTGVFVYPPGFNIEAPRRRGDVQGDEDA